MFLWHRKCYLFALDLSRWVSVFTTEPQWFPGNGNCLCARQMPHTKLGWEKPLCQIWNLSKIEDWGSTHAEKHDLFLIDLSNLIFHFTMCRWTNLKNSQRNIREKLVIVHVNMHTCTYKAAVFLSYFKYETNKKKIADWTDFRGNQFLLVQGVLSSELDDDNIVDCFCFNCRCNIISQLKGCVE